MPHTQIIQWSLLGLSLLFGIVAILALFKLRDAERFLPQWNELTELQATLPVRREELRQATEEKDKRLAEIGQLEATHGHLRILKEWQNANPEASARIQQMMIDLERWKSELNAVQQKLAQDEQRFNDITQETNRLTLEKAQLNQEASTLRDHCASLQDEKSELEKSNRDLDDQRRLAEITLSTLKEQIAAKETELTSLRTQLDQAVRDRREAIADRDQVGSERDAAKLELTVLAKRVETTQQDLTRLCDSVEAKSKEKCQLEEEVVTLMRKRDSVASDSLKAEEELRKLNSQLDQLNRERQAVIAERDKAFSDRDAARTELEGLKKSIEFYNAILENHKKQLEQASVGHTDLAKALEDLAQPTLKFNFQHAAQLDETAALRHLAEHLRAKGLHYPDRVQLAFHTSLKAAHINPLVVLAGVSGTGKSALPMAYAEATGMNFVSLAVQPGWSGPQDLLGFYNYLERKYKATELARALAQMSRFSADDLPGVKIESRKEQMLLLLLDEMNLARIEYYFSDFLSRLEQRRGRNIDDPQRRREVSLLVDAGSLPSTEMPRFIFPDFNVLFVGTMNEDESTQSLSDKVIDRANVLRFGAPKELRATSAPMIAPTPNFLPRETWQKWVKPFDGNGLDNERNILAQLNQTLETVNRPFGHRVFRAILDYLANYPNALTDAGRRRNALADQMEQKIIPKLRGLDTQDDATARCLDQLGQTISNLQDSELGDAFSRARQQHLFEWFGVKRS
jgi:uncharacterized protein (DUF3084 family)